MRFGVLEKFFKSVKALDYRFHVIPFLVAHDPEHEVRDRVS